MDAEMADVVITLHEVWVDKIDEALLRLAEVGLDVTNVDRSTGVVEGSLDVARMPSIQALEMVAYIRKVIEYDVNYPPGDPRDRDGR